MCVVCIKNIFSNSRKEIARTHTHTKKGNIRDEASFNVLSAIACSIYLKTQSIINNTFVYCEYVKNAYYTLVYRIIHTYSKATQTAFLKYTLICVMRVRTRVHVLRCDDEAPVEMQSTAR